MHAIWLYASGSLTFALALSNDTVLPFNTNPVGNYFWVMRRGALGMATSCCEP